MKKKRLFIVILIIIVLCVLALLIWKNNQPKEYKPEIIEPEVFEDKVYDTDLIIGLWQSGTVFYRFNEDGSGITWDIADDVTELEGSKLTWEVNKTRFIHYHQMEVNDAIIPKAYNINNLDLMNLEIEDDYDVKTTFIKVE
mgnify:FL=1